MPKLSQGSGSFLVRKLIDAPNPGVTLKVECLDDRDVRGEAIGILQHQEVYPVQSSLQLFGLADLVVRCPRPSDGAGVVEQLHILVDVGAGEVGLPALAEPIFEVLPAGGRFGRPGLPAVEQHDLHIREALDLGRILDHRGLGDHLAGGDGRSDFRHGSREGGDLVELEGGSRALGGVTVAGDQNLTRLELLGSAQTVEGHDVLPALAVAAGLLGDGPQGGPFVSLGHVRHDRTARERGGDHGLGLILGHGLSGRLGDRSGLDDLLGHGQDHDGSLGRHIRHPDHGDEDRHQAKENGPQADVGLGKHGNPLQMEVEAVERR